MAAVILHNTHRNIYRDVILRPDELFCTPELPPPAKPPSAIETSRPSAQGLSPRGYYDIAGFLRTLPAPWRNPSLLMVFYDVHHNSIPVNLAEVKCPKILSIGDTHHLNVPLQLPIEYARREPFDLVILEFNRQHLHFFHEAGIRHARWLPSFAISPFEFDPGTPKKHKLVFLGAFDKHPNRLRILRELAGRGVGFQTGVGNRKETCKIYSETRLNLNISLNGDLNQRVLEVLAAGGFLLTDRLHPESGLATLFEDKRHLVMFDSTDHLIEMIGYYERHPEEAEAIAACGHAQYMKQHRPERKIKSLMHLLKNPDQLEYEPEARSGLPAGGEFADRLALYEVLQEMHRVNVHTKILFWKGMERQACDAVDLPRARIWVLREPGETSPNPLQMAGLANRVEWIDPAALDPQKGQWNLLVCRIADVRDPLFQRCQAVQAADAVLFSDSDSQTPVPDLGMVQWHTKKFLIPAFKPPSS